MSGQQQILTARGNIGEGAPQSQTGGSNFFLKADGTCSNLSGTNPTPSNWYTIAPQPGVGVFYWIKATDTGGTGTAAPLIGASISGFTNMAGGGPLISIPSGIGTRTYNYQISSSASGTPVVATGTGATLSNSA